MLGKPGVFAIGGLLEMKRLVSLVRTGPVVVGEFRGGKAEVARRFDKTDKNAAPQEFGMYKFNLELLGDGSPVIVTVFLDVGTKAEEFATKVQIKRGDVVVVAVSKLEMKNGVRRANCGSTNFFVLDKSEADQLRSGSQA
jgi:hypothetical protein